jgi:hypothetical protein
VAEDPAAAAQALAVAAFPAVSAHPARGDARRQHPVALGQAADAAADGHDGADGLVAEHAARSHLGHVAAEDV